MPSDTSIDIDAGLSTVHMIRVVAVLGVCFVSIPAGLEDALVLWFTALGALRGGAVLLGLTFAERRPSSHGWREWTVIAALGQANTTIGFTAMFIDTLHVATEMASVVANAQPLLIVLPARALYAERRRSASSSGSRSALPDWW